ncbi:type VI secretion system baseplate subunit TssF, partial [Pseudomonas sp. ATCC 13867]
PAHPPDRQRRRQGALYDLLGAHACGLIAKAEGANRNALPACRNGSASPPNRPCCPRTTASTPGLRLLAEYFAFPDKFAFFDVPLHGLRASGEQLYLYILFDRPAPARLTLQASDLALGCVPAINLFPRTSEPLRPDGTRSEYRLVADAHRENSVEIHSIRSLRASTPQGVVEVAPYHGTQHRPGAFGLYWHARRVEGMTPNRRGSDLLLSLVDAGLQPLEETPQYSLSAELLCTNRSLAEYLPAGTELSFERPGPVARATLLRAPSRQSQPALDGPSRWQLVSQLTLNHLSLVEGPQALDALREILALHDFSEDKLASRQIEGLVALDCERVVDHVGSDAWRGWRNGLEVRVHLERQAFVGASAVLFSAVLAQFFSLYANANRFVRTVLVQSDQEICRWQPQAGQPITL